MRRHGHHELAPEASSSRVEASAVIPPIDWHFASMRYFLPVESSLTAHAPGDQYLLSVVDQPIAVAVPNAPMQRIRSETSMLEAGVRTWWLTSLWQCPVTCHDAAAESSLQVTSRSVLTMFVAL